MIPAAFPPAVVAPLVLGDTDPITEEVSTAAEFFDLVSGETAQRIPTERVPAGFAAAWVRCEPGVPPGLVAYERQGVAGPRFLCVWVRPEQYLIDQAVLLTVAYEAGKGQYLRTETAPFNVRQNDDLPAYRVYMLALLTPKGYSVVDDKTGGLVLASLGGLM